MRTIWRFAAVAPVVFGLACNGGTPPRNLAASPTGETASASKPPRLRQLCKYINLPVDVAFDVVRFHSAMEGTSHHLNVYKRLSDPTATVSAADALVHDCEPGSEQLSGDAAYIFGSASPERTVDMPPGVAFHLVPQQRIILEQHMINGSITAHRGLNFASNEVGRR